MYFSLVAIIWFLFTLPSFCCEGAVATVAFLSIASQVTAAPMNFAQCYGGGCYTSLILDKHDAKYLICFEGVYYARLDAIAAKMLASGKMKAHRANLSVTDTICKTIVGSTRIVLFIFSPPFHIYALHQNLLNRHTACPQFSHCFPCPWGRPSSSKLRREKTFLFRAN